MFGSFRLFHSKGETIRVSVLTLALCAAAAIAEPASEPAADAPAPSETGQAGAAAYAQSCARCHGATGVGDGLDSKRFYPRPRNLALGVYKFRSTASGTPPTDADLFRTITQGLPGTNMPDWQHLSEETRWQLVSYLKSLSPGFEQTKPVPLAVAADPGAAHVQLKDGRALYEKLGCAACHGRAGRANGTSAAGLVDDWGMPIRPADLTQGWNYRGGSDPRSVMLRVLAGIDGAGMPSYAEAITPQEAWPLAYYVASLQRPAHWNMIAHPLRVRGVLPTALNDPRWAQAGRTDVRLRNVVTTEGEWASPPTVTAVSVEAIDNGEATAFRFSWNDPTQDPPATQNEAARAGRTPSDAFALLLKPSGSQGDVVTLQAWPYAGLPAAAGAAQAGAPSLDSARDGVLSQVERTPALDLCRWSADTGQVSEAIATSFESPVAPQTRPALTSVSGYADGQWRLVLRRPRHPADPVGAATIAGDGYTAIAFAVWDGGNSKARAVSPWVEIALREDAGRDRQ